MRRLGLRFLLTTKNTNVHEGKGLAALAFALTAGAARANSPPPATPDSVDVSRSDGKLTARWDAVPDAVKYHVTYSYTGGANWHLAALAHTSTSIEIDAHNSRTYIVGVRAGKHKELWSGWRNSPPAAPFRPPAAPTGLTATAGDGSVALKWNDPSDPSITGYEYQVNHNDTSTGRLSGWGSWQEMDGSGPETVSHSIGGLTNGCEYRFRMRASNAAGTSALAPTAYPWYVVAVPKAPESAA